MGIGIGVVATIGGALVAHNSNDWTHWRGPNASGVAPDRSLPTRWSATDQVAWKAPIEGVGVSTPIVSGDHVYVTSQLGSGVRRPGNHPRLVQGADAAAQGERSLDARASRLDASKTYFVVEAFARRDGSPVWKADRGRGTLTRFTTSTISRRRARHRRNARLRLVRHSVKSSR
jgi:hypothetical protein